MPTVLYIVCFMALGALIGALVHSVWVDWRPRDIKAHIYLTKQKNSNGEDILVPYLEFTKSVEEFMKETPTTIEVRVFYDEQ